MITLYTFGPGFGLRDLSPFVRKAQLLLKMSGQPFQEDRTGFRKAPKGKLPFIDDDGTLVADSAFIRDYIERTYAVDLDRALDTGQRARAWAIERMLEDHLYWVIIHTRWAVDENFTKGPAHFFDAVPAPARDQVRKQARERVLAALHGHGLGRHNADEIAALGRKTLDSLAVILGEGPFLFGNQPCGADATAFGFVASALCPLFDAPLRRAAEAHRNLIAYRDRMMLRYYPEFLRSGSDSERELADA